MWYIFIAVCPRKIKKLSTPQNYPPECVKTFRLYFVYVGYVLYIEPNCNWFNVIFFKTPSMVNKIGTTVIFVRFILNTEMHQKKSN